MFLPKKKQDELYHRLRPIIDGWKQHWDKIYLNQFMDYRRMANGELPTELATKLAGKDYTYHSKLVPRVIPQGISYLKSTLVNSVFNRDNIFEFVGRRDEDFSRAQNAYDLVSYEFEITGVQEILEMAIEDACEVGGGWVERMHYTERVLAPTYNENMALNRSHFEEIYAGPKLLYLKPEMVYPDPKATHLSEITGYFKIMSVPISELKQNAVEGGIYYEYAKNLNNIKSGDYDPSVKEESMVQDDHKDASEVADPDFPVMVCEIWKRMSIEPDKFPAWHLITIANYNTKFQIIRLDRDPMRTGTHPLRMIRVYPKNGRLYGESIPEKIQAYMLEMWHKRNQAINLVNLAVDLSGMILGAEGQFDANSLAAKRGKILKVRSGDAKNVGTIPIDTSSLPHVINQVALIEKDIESELAASRVTMGLAASRRETATTTAVVDENSKIRANSPIRAVENTGIKPIAKDFLLHSQLLMDENFIIRVLGPKGYDFKNMSRADILGLYDVKCYGSSEVLSKGIKQALMDKFAQIYLGNPLVRMDRQKFVLEHMKSAEIAGADHIVDSLTDEQAEVDRENGAFLAGMQGWEALMHEDHDTHIIGHMEVMEQMKQGGAETAYVERHILDHQQKKAEINGQSNLNVGKEMPIMEDRGDFQRNMNSDMGTAVLSG
jgi:hypothetical protein